MVVDVAVKSLGLLVQHEPLPLDGPSSLTPWVVCDKRGVGRWHGGNMATLSKRWIGKSMVVVIRVPYYAVFTAILVMGQRSKRASSDLAPWSLINTARFRVHYKCEEYFHTDPKTADGPQKLPGPGQVDWLV